MMKKTNKSAFTIVETLISMGFVAVLIILIGLVSLQMINIYRKGISIKTINSVSQLIIDDMKRSINSSPNLICLTYDNGGYHNANCNQLSEAGAFGAGICTGKYSYFWNYGPILNNSSRSGIKFAGNEVRLYKVTDQNSELCHNLSNISSIVEAKSDDDKKELINASDRNIALHSFVVHNQVSSNIGDQIFYNISFVLGTFDDNLIKTSDASCKNPAELNQAGEQGNSSYCAINKFNFSARSVSGKG